MFKSVDDGFFSQAMAAFELDEKLMNDNKAAFFVPDLVRRQQTMMEVGTFNNVSTGSSTQNHAITILFSKVWSWVEFIP